MDAHVQTVVGNAAADDTWFFHGYAAWPLERLQREADRGLWTVIEAPALHLLELAKNHSWAGFVEEVRAAAA